MQTGGVTDAWIGNTYYTPLVVPYLSGLTCNLVKISSPAYLVKRDVLDTDSYIRQNVYDACVT